MRRIIYGTLMVLSMGVLLISCNKEGCVCTYHDERYDEDGKEYVDREEMLNYFHVKTCSALSTELKKEYGDDVKNVRCK